MRSRYTAYTRGDIGYLEKTLAPESRSDFDAGETKKWADSAEWKGLQIISAEKGTERDRTGTVEFVAKYGLDGKVLAHHEVSKFRRTNSGQWLFVAGRSRTREEGESDRNHHPAHTITRDAPKIGRNDPCPCGSGKKYKKCCGAV